MSAEQIENSHVAVIVEMILGVPAEDAAKIMRLDLADDSVHGRDLDQSAVWSYANASVENPMRTLAAFGVASADGPQWKSDYGDPETARWLATLQEAGIYTPTDWERAALAPFAESPDA